MDGIQKIIENFSWKINTVVEYGIEYRALVLKNDWLCFKKGNDFDKLFIPYDLKYIVMHWGRYGITIQDLDQVCATTDLRDYLSEEDSDYEPEDSETDEGYSSDNEYESTEWFEYF